ncbi:MAG: aminotransferase class I/II-fold pyridoxal phosphate-dependent enzyme [Clostridia bacterium]|nr:aminotransferase class I/II-fold pyridoxal phosphate-dependent enzyme [Clostridia bacterium]
MEKLAILGGEPCIKEMPPEELYAWPIITEEDENAALEVIRNNSFSGTDITTEFENEFADWLGVNHAVAYCNGTMSLAASMFAVGLGTGDEIICPTKTYWGSIAQTVNFGATPVFCNITEMLSIDPDDIERCITPRTKAIMVVHYFSYPADMDRITAIAKKHGLYIIEDVSHAQGGMYKGKRLGTFGDIAAMSLMSGKSFAAGELGIVVTNSTRLYERALAYGHYERNNASHISESEELCDYFGIALGGVKGRANQLCSAIARVQLKYYDERCKEIRRAMNYFWDLLEGLPGIRPIRVDESTGSNMAGFYGAQGAYIPGELGGLSVKRFAEAVRAELNGTGRCWDGGNFCLHTHNFFKTFDFRHSGTPSRIEFCDRDARAEDEALKISEERYCFSVPWIKKYDKEWIEKLAAAFRKVVCGYTQLLEEDTKSAQGGRWYGTDNE